MKMRRSVIAVVHRDHDPREWTDFWHDLSSGETIESDVLCIKDPLNKSLLTCSGRNASRSSANVEKKPSALHWKNGGASRHHSGNSA